MTFKAFGRISVELVPVASNMRIQESGGDFYWEGEDPKILRPSAPIRMYLLALSV